MSSSSTVRTAMPRNRMGTECEPGSLAVRPTGARKPPKRAGETHAGDARTAKWFSAGVEAYGKADAYGSVAGLGKNDLSEMRSGKRSVALRRLLPMLENAPSALAFCNEFLAAVEMAEHPDEVLLFVGPLLESIGYVARPVKTLTRTELGELILDDLDDGSAVTRKLIENAAAKRGHGPRHVAMALRREPDPTE